MAARDARPLDRGEQLRAGLCRVGEHPQALDAVLVPALRAAHLAHESVGQVISLYAADPYRAAGHDPLVVGLNLTPTTVYAFGGFLPPIDAAPTLNDVNAGSVVPVKFSLGGGRGQAVFAPGDPASREVSCRTGAPLSVLQPTATLGQSGLHYDATTDTYGYIWRTERSWSDTCRELMVKVKDASVWSAGFRMAR